MKRSGADQSSPLAHLTKPELQAGKAVYQDVVSIPGGKLPGDLFLYFYVLKGEAANKLQIICDFYTDPYNTTLDGSIYL